jgi:hypothetical protein
MTLTFTGLTRLERCDPQQTTLFPHVSFENIEFWMFLALTNLFVKNMKKDNISYFNLQNFSF